MEYRRNNQVRGLAAALLSASLLAGGAGVAWSQSTLPLKGTLDSVEENAATPPKPTQAQLSETALEIAPPEPVEPGAIAPRNTSAADPYAPLGFGHEGLRLYVSLNTSAVYSDNVNESASDPKSDTGLGLKPTLRLESNWSRHSLNANLTGDFVSYRDNQNANTQTLDSDAVLRLDIRRNLIANLEAGYTIDTPANEDPVEHTFTSSAGITRDFGRLRATLEGGAVVRHYEDSETSGGASQSNDDLNYVQPSVLLRTSYGVSDLLRPYIELAYTPRHHSDTPDRNGFDRDSQGYGASAGVEIAAGPLWTGELGLTYLHRNYNDGSLAPADAFGLTGVLTWSPTELTSIVFAASTSIDESSSTTEGGQPTWIASVNATHALRDNVDLTAGASIEIDDLGTTYEKTYDANLGVAWKFNPVLSWTAGYDLTWLDQGSAGSGYVEQRISTGLTVTR